MKITLDSGTVIEISELGKAEVRATSSAPKSASATLAPPKPPATTTALAKPRQADAVTPKPPATKTEPKAAQPTREAVPPAPSAQTQPPASEEHPSQPVSNPLHSFDLQGGTNDILDPGRGNPNCYQFVQPKGEA